jgi:hypothetical protein
MVLVGRGSEGGGFVHGFLETGRDVGTGNSHSEHYLHAYRSCWVTASGRCSWKAASHETEQSMEWLLKAFALTGTATLGGGMFASRSGEPQAYIILRNERID